MALEGGRTTLKGQRLNEYRLDWIGGSEQKIAGDRQRSIFVWVLNGSDYRLDGGDWDCYWVF
jgi:hypothetical protein